MHSSRRIRTLTQTALVTAALTAGMIAAPRTFAQTSQIDNPDWPLRSSDIHWPAGHTPADADLFAHNELLIDAPCLIVWQHLVQETAFPCARRSHTGWSRGRKHGVRPGSCGVVAPNRSHGRSHASATSLAGQQQ
jgi:hypothetical protein